MLSRLGRWNLCSVDEDDKTCKAVAGDAFLCSSSDEALDASLPHQVEA